VVAKTARWSQAKRSCARFIRRIMMSTHFMVALRQPGTGFGWL
jgi:hypothetical protein